MRYIEYTNDVTSTRKPETLALRNLWKKKKSENYVLIHAS